LLLAQTNPTFVQLTAAEPVSPTQIGTRDVRPTNPPLSPETATLVQTMARDLANFEREVEQLKASHQQLASDNAKAIEQIRASQEQAARDMASNTELLKTSQDQVAQLLARASEQKVRPKISAPQPQAAVVTRKPIPTPATSQPSPRPQASRQLRPEER
jgi:hypothetical protein